MTRTKIILACLCLLGCDTARADGGNISPGAENGAAFLALNRTNAPSCSAATSVEDPEDGDDDEPPTSPILLRMFDDDDLIARHGLTARQGSRAGRGSTAGQGFLPATGAMATSFLGSQSLALAGRRGGGFAPACVSLSSTSLRSLEIRLQI